MLPLPPIDLKDVQQKLATHFRPWQRSFQFWVRAVDIYTGYKVFQLRVSLVKDAKKQEEMWERQHEFAAEKIYAMCSDLGGFFLKVAQIIGKPDLAPAAWVKRLVTLCDHAPATPFDAVQLMLEMELGRNVGEVFERFDVDPLGSASIAQVHRARLRGDKSDVVVKVQHPGVQDLMMTDIRNLQAFAFYIQKTDVKFDLYSITKEMEKQIGYEFDFIREADGMEKIRRFLYENNKKSPVLVPRLIRDIVTRRVLVMEYIDGTPILNLGDEIAKRGINPGGKIAAAAKQKILQSLTLAYGQMILKTGFFHADPHPGNILICRGSEVALLDYGQVKDLPDELRLGYANLVLAIADGDPIRASESYSVCTSFGIVKEEDVDLYRKLVVSSAWRKQMPKLAVSLGLAKQMPDMIEELISRGQQLDAVHFTYEVGLVHKFPPVPLLKAFLKDAKKAAASILEDPNNAGRAANLAGRKELSALRAVVKCIEDYNLETEFPPENLKKRLEQLEKVKPEKKRPVVVPANKRTRANNGGPMPPAKAGRLTNAYVSSFPTTPPTFVMSPSHGQYPAGFSPYHSPPTMYGSRSPPTPYAYSPEAAPPPAGSYPGAPMNYPAYGAYGNGMVPAYQQAYYR